MTAYQIILTADTISEYINDFNMATDDTASPHVTGDVRLPITKNYAVILRVGIAIQGSGGNSSWRLADKDPDLGPRILTYSTGTLTDYLIDAEVIGIAES